MGVSILSAPQQERRPWLDLYMPQHGLLAQRICRLPPEDDGLGGDGGLGGLPAELWMLIVSKVPPEEFASLGVIGCTCHVLRSVARHPQHWEAFCLSAFSLPGFLSSEPLLRLYSWSWRQMFMQRKRLRFDGVYYITTRKLLHGLNEGRGMKEKDQDFYDPGGRWVVSYEIFRFFSSGIMLSYLVGSHTPAQLLKDLMTLRPDNLRSQSSRLGTVRWGQYTLQETLRHPGSEEGEPRDLGERHGAPTCLEGRVRLTGGKKYPNMIPSIIRYAFELRSTTPTGGTNAGLYKTFHTVETDMTGAGGGDGERLEVKLPWEPANFLHFGAVQYTEASN
jgi:hypothetical protein